MSHLSTVLVGAFLAAAPLTQEMPANARYIDLRDVFTDMNVIAEPPPGETCNKAPAFRKTESTAKRLDVSLNAKGKAFELEVHFGDRKASITLTP